mgnify:CR=1 FL=1
MDPPNYLVRLTAKVPASLRYLIEPLGASLAEAVYSSTSWADLESDERDVYALVERMIMSIGAPFVPIKHEGVIYVRPPVS